MFAEMAEVRVMMWSWVKEGSKWWRYYFKPGKGVGCEVDWAKKWGWAENGVIRWVCWLGCFGFNKIKGPVGLFMHKDHFCKLGKVEGLV